MADDPLFGFKPPAPAADPLMGFKPTVPAGAPGQDLGTTALWNKPANTSWSDYLLAHLAKPFQGTGQAAKDYARTAFDAGTFGFGNDIQSAISGNTPEQERAATAAASSRLGAMAPIVSGAMYALGPGELGAASKIGGALGGGWLGGIAGSAAEGAAAGGLGAAGHDESIGKGALVGGLLGGAGGLPGGVVSRGGALAPAMSEDALRARATQEYAPLDAMIFHGPSQIKPALDAVENTMTGAEKDLAKSTMAKVGKLGDQDLASGSDIQSYQKIFGRLAKTGSDADREFAPKFKSALEGVMNAEPYGRNLTPGQGMSLMLPGPLGGTGFAAGDAAAARNAGDVFHGRANDIRRLNDWIDESQVKGGGPDVGSQASSWLRSDTGKPFAKPGTPPYDALNTLAATAGTRQTSFAPSAFDLRHALYPIAGGAITGAGMGAAHGSDPGTIAEEALLGATMGYGLHVGAPAVYNKLVSIPGQQRAIDAARSTLSTGNYQAPVLPNATLRDALRTLIFGQGARGAY